MAKKEVDLRIQQSEKYEGDEWWSWAVWIDGAPEQLRDVEFVEYTLHPSFPDPVRVVRTKDNNFKLSTGGWGIFPIHARVVTKSGAEVRLTHDLSLHYPSGEANTA